MSKLLDRLRQEAKASVAAKKAADRAAPTERRVYTLPTSMMERIIQFQIREGLQSEAHAVRRLLDDALRHWEAGQI